MAILFTVSVVRPVFSFIRGDWPAQFFPVYSYLGERLRSFDIPGWNPHQFSGAPFVGDPESGWMYVPAMLTYALLTPEAATIVYIGFHIALAGIATYVLARLLGLNVIGSLIAGVSYALSWVAPSSMHLVIFFPAGIWLVVALIGSELAIRATTWASRIWSWLFAAVAISQILAIWLGQASYYALVAIGGWIAYRTLLVPTHLSRARDRLKNFVVTCLGVFGIAFGISAASVLPRIDMVSRTNLAGGVYDVISSWEEAQTGYSPLDLLREIVGGYTGSLWWYVGAVSVALAFIAPIIAYRWRAMGYFVLLAGFSLVLALDQRTPLHGLLYVFLPRFRELHEHSPERVLILLGPAVALLAGATVSYLSRWERSRLALLAIALVPASLALVLLKATVESGEILSREATVIIVASSTIVVCFSLATSRTIKQLALLGLLFLVTWDPAGRMLYLGFVDESRLERSLYGSLAEDPKPFLYENGAARFIAANSTAAPVRYAGFNPALLPDPNTVPPDFAYRGWASLREPVLHWLLVLNWGTWFGIDDVQGYNPLQGERYVIFMDALNGHRQEYHERNIFPAGLTSPLLDLLNLRFLVFPAVSTSESDLPASPAGFNEVYADAHIRVLENEDAFPRAWLVHEAQNVDPEETLSLLASGQVDPRQTALLETDLPPLNPALDPVRESAVYVGYEPDRIELHVSATAPSLLVLSEVWDPGWSATVDGKDAPVLVANYLLRAIPMPQGDHRVILQYDPPLLKIGLLVSAATFLLFGGAASGLAWRARRERRNSEGESA